MGLRAILEQDVETNQLIVEEIAKIVESKNISHNLEVIQSAPVDPALPPVHPLTPSVFLWTILGCFLGAVLGSGIALAKTLSNGIRISAENLKLAGYHVSGIISPPLYSSKTKLLRDVNLETLRRLQTYFDKPASIQEAKLLLLLEGRGPDYASALAELFSQKGCRVLIMDLHCTESQENSPQGLLQYLQGESDAPPIQKREQWDEMCAGGSNRYATEKIGSPVFGRLIEQLKTKYDWILAVSGVLPCSAEAESLALLFPYLAVTLQRETIEELNFYTRFLKQSMQHKLTFLLAPSAQDKGKKWN